MYDKYFPPIETALEMEPEELAPFVLRHLKELRNINRAHYTLDTVRELRDFAGIHLEDLQKGLWRLISGLSRRGF